MTYRSFIIVITLAGLIPALVTLVFFAVVDRPRRWDRYSHFIGALLTVIVLNYAGILLLTLSRNTRTGWPTNALGWLALIVFRGGALLIVWWLTWMYFTPRVRNEPPLP
jgi:hypothetical protein